MFYHYEANRLKVEKYVEKIHSFPVPELKIHDNGIEISNWSTRVFQRFLAVTEFPGHYYLSKDAWQKHCNPDPPAISSAGWRPARKGKELRLIPLLSSRFPYHC